ncbi:hypothetical protein ACHAWO_013077 [Cyclotella atomus]|uniref:Mitochondrial inner membrane protease ATP23 n=1 Tax=Cyclotella atomus TaxID=382360 RepID=A0ABD3NNJ0_9STRA
MPPLNPSHESSNSSRTVADLPEGRDEISRECQQCISYLTNALNQPGRAQSLLKSLGVVSPAPIASNEKAANKPTRNSSASNNQIANNESQKKRMYTPTPDGRGVVLHLNSQAALNSPVLMDTIQPRVSLQKRLTSAASRMVYGTNNSGSAASNSNDVNGAGAVLTTSPTADVEKMHQMAKQEMPKETTITIECMKCGSDTRAEAGARAYVRGPIPLSIILCSNRLSSHSEISEVLVHELVHVYDVFIRNMDLRQCHSLAYSEVRAARDAECDNSLTNFTKGICAKDKATVATKNMFPEEGRGCVCDVFEKAVSDLAPLGLKGDLNTAKDSANGEGNGGGSDVGGFGAGMTFMPREARPSER